MESFISILSRSLCKYTYNVCYVVHGHLSGANAIRFFLLLLLIFYYLHSTTLHTTLSVYNVYYIHSSIECLYLLAQ